MDFVAIDFETANYQSSSACAIGVTVVGGGSVVERRSWLIKPPQLYFNPFNVRIHGIRKQDVLDQPTFDELWPTLHPYLHGCELVAHNAAFDVGVLISTLDVYGIEYPELKYACTRLIAKKTWPDLPSYRLNMVAEHLGITFRHHDAGDDAFVCAEIARHACIKGGRVSLGELAKNNMIITGRLGPDTHIPAQQSKRISLTPATTEFDPDHPLYGQTVVFTGALKGMPRKHAMQQVVDLGGHCDTSITEFTTLLVTGTSRRGDSAAPTAKLRRANMLISRGFPIEFLNEEEFLAMLSKP